MKIMISIVMIIRYVVYSYNK